MLDMDLARKVLENDGFLSNHRIDISHIEEGKVVLSIPLEEGVMRIGGIMSGGVIMAFADAASALCVMTMEGVENEVTSAMNTHFYNPLKEGPAIFTATLKRGGKAIAYTHTEIKDSNEVLCAETMGTFRLFRNQA